MPTNPSDTPVELIKNIDQSDDRSESFYQAADFSAIPSMGIEWVGLDLAQPVEISKISLDRRRYYWCCQSDMEERDPANLMRFFPEFREAYWALAKAFWRASVLLGKVGTWVNEL